MSKALRQVAGQQSADRSAHSEINLNDRLTNKVVMITGASSGIGRGLAKEIAARGALVGLVARRADTLKELQTEIESAGGRGLAVAGDVRDASSIKAATDKIAKELGPIDVLVANAGIGTSTDGSQVSGEEVAKVISVNVIGAANSVSAVLPQMVERRKGQLVVISSLAAYRGLPKSAAYCASKAAVSAFFESLRLDLAPKGIDVTIIHPGFIKTPLTAGRDAQMPFLMELDDAVKKIANAIERRKKSYAFPWQLATIVRAGMIMPIWMYDRISRRNSFRE
jgi:short-subunit dehydrogenase